MAKFSDIAKGTRARKTVPFPIANTRCELLADLPELAAQRARDREAWEKASQEGTATPVAPDGHVLVDLRVLTGTEESLVLQKAREHAIQHGVSDPKDGEPLYEIGKMVHALAFGCVDNESPTENAAPFFDGGASQILDEVDGDRIAFLYARWQIWQGECSPNMRNLTAEQFTQQMVALTVSEDDLPFVQMAPVTQWISLRTLGALVLSSQEGRSLFTSAFDGSATPATIGSPPKKSTPRSPRR